MILEDLVCADCGSSMKIQEAAYGLFYACVRRPECSGALGAHSDGRPKGVPGNAVTRQARIRAHYVFDQIWKDRLKTRSAAYKWLRQALGTERTQGHIACLDQEACERLIVLVYRDYPSLRNVWSMLDDHADQVPGV